MLFCLSACHKHSGHDIDVLGTIWSGKLRLRECFFNQKLNFTQSLEGGVHQWRSSNVEGTVRTSKKPRSAEVAISATANRQHDQQVSERLFPPEIATKWVPVLSSWGLRHSYTEEWRGCWQKVTWLEHAIFMGLVLLVTMIRTRYSQRIEGAVSSKTGYWSTCILYCTRGTPSYN